MTDDRSNWTRAVQTRGVAVLVADLIRIGQMLGSDVAQRIYFALREEPRDAQGRRIDWLDIAGWIESMR